MLKVFGHLAPDTDSVCAPSVWAWYLESQQQIAATAYTQEVVSNTEANFVLDHWGIEPLPILDLEAGDPVIVVDTNNPGELPANIDEAEIVQIIDHHKLIGGLTTNGPIDITIRPVACTTTIMYDMMSDEDLEAMPRGIMGLMLSAIISDTLEFRSPTTTDRDREVAEDLAARLEVDMAELAAAMFEAKSDVSAFSDVELLRLDSKKYEVDGTTFRVAVLETTSPQVILDRKEALFTAMEQVAQEDEVDEVLLFIVDILNENSTLLIPNQKVKSVAEKSFEVSVEGDTVLLPGVVSRKKQIIPVLKVD